MSKTLILITIILSLSLLGALNAYFAAPLWWCIFSGLGGGILSARIFIDTGIL